MATDPPNLREHYAAILNALLSLPVDQRAHAVEEPADYIAELDENVESWWHRKYRRFEVRWLTRCQAEVKQ